VKKIAQDVAQHIFFVKINDEILTWKIVVKKIGQCTSVIFETLPK
jgi:hypothetical protein